MESEVRTEIVFKTAGKGGGILRVSVDGAELVFTHAGSEWRADRLKFKNALRALEAAAIGQGNAEEASADE